MLKTKKFRRLLAALLSVLMLSISLPLAAFAADGDETPKCSITYYADGEVFSSEPYYPYSANAGFFSGAIETSAAYQDLLADGYSYVNYTVKQLSGETVTYTGDEWRPVYVANHTWEVAVYFEKPAVAQDVNIRFEFVDANGAELSAASNIATTWSEDAEPAAVRDLIADAIQTVEGTGYVFDHMALVYDDGSESSALNEPVVVPDYNGKTIRVYFAKQPAPAQDVNIRFEFVDVNGAELSAASNIATTWSDDAAPVAVRDLIASEIQAVEGTGYVFDYMALVYDDGTESTALNNPVVVPDYNGKTIKVHFNRQPAPAQDVNIRFEFVDVNGAELNAAANIATTWSDDAAPVAVRDLIASENQAVEGTGYAFDRMTLVYDDGSESSALNNPVVVPDYNGKTIKVHFTRVPVQKDTNVRFEFVDMDGNSVLPATNYATVCSDDTIGPKVVDVIADEIAAVTGNGYKMDHLGWVMSDGSENVLNDPVIVPDYHNTTIKVYFSKVDQPTDPEEPTNPEEPATPTDPTDPGEPEQPAKPADENTTTVTSDSGKDTAKAEQVVKSDTAPAASATKVLPQTGVETAAPVLGFVVVLVAALGGAGCYLFVVRKKLN